MVSISGITPGSGPATDTDDINAAEDQRQSDRVTQARSDRQHAEQQPVSASEETEYTQSRDQRLAETSDRAARILERNVTSPRLRCVCRKARSGRGRSRPAIDEARRART